MNAPAISVSLVTYNGMRWLPGCLTSVSSQTCADYELLVLDNASGDGSVGWLRAYGANEPRMQLFESPANIGFAKGHNRNIERARGEFVLLLNQDVELGPAFLSEALAGFAARPRVAAVQAQLRRLVAPGERTDLLDSTGLQMGRDRRVVARRQGERVAARDSVPGPVWGVDGPAPVYRRSALLDARVPIAYGREVLDEDFFMYKEDVDLAWRLRLARWSSWYQPSAVAWHARSAGGPTSTSPTELLRFARDTPAWIRSISWRNQRLMQIKNERLTDVVRDLPWLLRRELGSAVLLAALPQTHVSVRREMRSALRKRRAIASHRG